MKTLQAITITLALSLAASGSARGQDSLSGGEDGKVLKTETVQTRDASGRVIQKRVVTKMRSRTVVDFEEASIEGKVKKPNAAYLLHGAELDFKQLYRIKNNQKNRISGSYEYVR